jgi:hypothetical protein
MGGVGSGRDGERHTYTDNYAKITAKGLTKRFTFLGVRIRPVYYPAAQVETSWGRFWLEWVECTKGGHRPYFKCPGGFGRTVFTLYAPPQSLKSGGRGIGSVGIATIRATRRSGRSPCFKTLPVFTVPRSSLA